MNSTKKTFSKGRVYEKKYPRLEALKAILKIPPVVWKNRYKNLPELFKRRVFPTENISSKNKHYIKTP